MYREQEFIDAIRSAGLEPPPNIIADGVIHRFRSNGDDNPNSWYTYHDDYGSFGCWKRGIKRKLA